jgi:hypothetical protein
VTGDDVKNGTKEEAGYSCSGGRACNLCTLIFGGYSNWEGFMRAILRKQFGGPDVLEIREMPEPEPKAGHAVIQVKAFGINHAEMHMRKGEWAEIAEVSGIECVGVVKSCPAGNSPLGPRSRP